MWSATGYPEEAVATSRRRAASPLSSHPASAPDPTGLVGRLAQEWLLGVDTYYWGNPPLHGYQLVRWPAGTTSSHGGNRTPRASQGRHAARPGAGAQSASGLL